MWERIKLRWATYINIFLHVHQPHLEVIDGDLVLGGVAVGHRFEDGSVVSFGPQQVTKFPQHRGTVGRNGCVTSQVSLRDAGKVGEQLLGVWVLCE